MYKRASKFFQDFKERHGKNVIGKYKPDDPKPKKSSKGKKKSKNASKSKQAVISTSATVTRLNNDSKGKQKTKINQTLSELLAKIYGRAEASVPSIKRRIKREWIKKEGHPLMNVKIIRLKKKVE